MARRRQSDAAVSDYQATIRYRLSVGFGRRLWSKVPASAVEEQVARVQWQQPNDLRVDVVGRRFRSRNASIQLSSVWDRPWFVPRGVDDSVRIFSNDFPATGALHPPANDELDEIFDAYFADPDLWVAILTGAGDQAFSAGNDLGYPAGGRPMWVPKNGFAGLTGRRAMTKPVIAAVNGYALGGGFEIALACHLVVADSTAKFGLTEVKVGLVAAAGGLVRLPRAIPPKLATELILTGRRLDAAEALDLGLVNRVTEAGGALAGARALADEILAGSPTSVRASLRIMAETDGIADTVDAVTHPSGALDELMASEDVIEGVTAFAQKRPPTWRNR